MGGSILRRVERLEEAAAPSPAGDRRLDLSVLTDEEKGRLCDYIQKLRADKEARGLAERDYDVLTDDEQRDYREILQRLVEANGGTAT